MFVLLAGLVALGSGIKLPASYSQCKTGDEPCVVQAITNTFHKFQGGVPALGLASLDPLRIDEMDIVQGTGPVNIVLNFKNVDITGFKDVAVKKAKVSPKLPT